MYNKKRKWDSVLLLVKDKNVSLILIEFSGGVSSNNTSIKKQSDTSKLYNMMKVFEYLPETIKKQVFAIRFFSNASSNIFYQSILLFTNPYYYDSIDNGVHFEQSLFHKDNYIHSQRACIICPTMPRLLLDYVKEVPNLMKWKDAIVNNIFLL